jgi:hypothetical protein
MRYRVTHRSAAARPGLTQVLGLIPNMDATDYKEAKAGPGVISSAVLEEILRVVAECDSQLGLIVHRKLISNPLERPESHNEASGSAWLRIDLPDDLAEEVLDCLSFSEVGAVGTDGSTNAAASRAAGLVDAWQNWMEGREA